VDRLTTATIVALILAGIKLLVLGFAVALDALALLLSRKFFDLVELVVLLRHD